VRIEIDLFSGRPNPAWDATTGEATRVRAAVDALCPRIGPAPEPPGLGYRGFRVTEPGWVAEVYGTAVTVTEHAGRSVRHDPNRDVERLLLALSHEHLDPALLALLDSEPPT
jgi:hypothetical protein